jgi:cytoskeletal protein CcmA (bactofilin family)
MALKPFNSLGGLAVGPNLVPVINSTADGTFRDLHASGNVTFDSQEFAVSGNTSIAQNLVVSGGAGFEQGVTIAGLAEIGSASIATDLSVGGQLGVSGDVTLSSDLSVSGEAAVGSLIVSGVTDLGSVGNVRVAGGTAGQVLKTDGAGNLFWDQIDPMSKGDTEIDINDDDGHVYISVNGVANIFHLSEEALNLDVDANFNSKLNVSHDASFAEDVTIGDGLSIGDSLTVGGRAELGGQLFLTGDAYLQANVSIATQLAVSGEILTNTINTSGGAIIGAGLDVVGDAEFKSGVEIRGSAQVDGTVDIGHDIVVSDDASIGGDLSVAGTTTVQALSVAGDLSLSGLSVNRGVAFSDNGVLKTDSSFTFTADGDINTNGSVNSRWFNAVNGINAGYATQNAVAFVDANRDVVSDSKLGWNGSTLQVTGQVGATGNLVIGGQSEFAGDVSIASDLSVDGAITAPSGTFSVGVVTADLTATGEVDLGHLDSITIAGGTAGQVLKTDGAGGLTWETNAILVNGTSNVAIPSAGGDVAVSVDGVANVVVIGSESTVVNTDLQVLGNLIVSGSQTDINVQNLNVSDPVITTGRGENYTPLTLNDGLDRGVFSYYFEGTEKGAFVGFKNPSAASADAGKYVIAKRGTVTDNVLSVGEYADVVVASVQSGADGGASRVELKGGAVEVVAGGVVTQVVNAGVTTLTGATRVQGELFVNDTVGQTTARQVTTTVSQVSIASFTDTIPGAVFEVTVRGRNSVTGATEVNKYMVLSDAAGTIDFTATNTLRIVGTPGEVDFIRVSGEIRVVVTAASVQATEWTASIVRMM